MPLYAFARHSSDGALPTTARRAKRENGGLGEDPPGKSDDTPAGPLSTQIALLNA
jgi:hypothetical protein